MACPGVICRKDDIITLTKMKKAVERNNYAKNLKKKRWGHRVETAITHGMQKGMFFFASPRKWVGIKE